ncbi:hypothetical protein QQP08_016240 [Theobroma cacao]|nr:hypothetical protein QQP08_016240 [Theobroma cacao]
MVSPLSTISWSEEKRRAPQQLPKIQISSLWPCSVEVLVSLLPLFLTVTNSPRITASVLSAIISCLLNLHEMDPQGQNLVEAILLALEVALAKERDNTRLMEERLRAGQAALKAKERERSMLTTEKDRVLALKEDGEKLVSDFLEADGKKNFDDQKAMMDAVVAMINSGGGDGGKGGGFDGFYERGINYLENAQNLNEKAVLATVKGTNSDGNDNSHGGGNGGDGGKGGGFDGVYGGPINDLENAQILDEEAVIATAKGTNSDGNGSSHGGGNGGGYGV